MLSEFEARLADVLGTRLPEPLRGTVDVAPGRAEALIVLSTRSVRPLAEELFVVRPELVPGGLSARRVSRLRCELVFELRPGQQTRAEQMSAYDELLYALDDPALRTGAPLLPGDAADPGFVIRQFGLTAGEPPASLAAYAEGLFWPVGVAGQTGIPIAEARLRLGVVPARLVPAAPRISAGGTALDLRVEFGEGGVLRVEAGGRVTGLPFGSIVASLVDAGGRPGAGSLEGGAAGAEGTRVLPVASGSAELRYTPPAAPARDVLVVSLEDARGGAGIELGRFALEVRGA